MTSIMSAPPEWLRSSPTRWYIVFSKAQSSHWWDRLFRLDPKFNHVYALRWDGFNWILFDPHAAFTEVVILAVAHENALRWLVPVGSVTLEVEAFRQKGIIRGRWWAGPMTCVEQIKALLGIRSQRVWTPMQLYNYLLRGQHGQFEQTAAANRAGTGSGSAATTAVKSSYRRHQ